MASFNGFKEGKSRLTQVPGQFFSELLPEIDHLGELKLILYVFWRMDRMEGTFRWLRRSDFAADSLFMKSLGDDERQAGKALDDALERAVLRGSLLKIDLSDGNKLEGYYFLNSPKGRAAVEAIRLGKWQPAGELQLPLELGQERPNIFKLYEENVGPLTPMLAESLRDAEGEYPPEWIEDAFRIAVESNKRNWRYIQAILRRWKEDGRDDQDRSRSQKNPRRYIEGEFSEFVEH